MQTPLAYTHLLTILRFACGESVDPHLSHRRHLLSIVIVRHGTLLVHAAKWRTCCGSQPPLKTKKVTHPTEQIIYTQRR